MAFHSFGISLSLLILCWNGLVHTSQASGPFVRKVRGQTEKDDSPSRVGRRREEYVTNNSHDDGDRLRLHIDEFQLVLEPTLVPINTRQQHVLRGLVQSVLSDYLSDQSDSFQAIMLLAIQDNIFSGRRRLESSTTLLFGGGVAMFSTEGAPSKKELDDWIAVGLRDFLPSALKTTAGLETVTTVTYVSLSTNSPTSAPIDQQTFGGIEVAQGRAVDDSGSTPWAIVGGVVGGLVVVAVVAALLLASHRRRRLGQDESFQSRKAYDETTNVESIQGDDLHNISTEVEDGSLTEDSDAFTLSTATDDHTIRSIASRKFPPKPVPVYKMESFEHDRQVSIKKDMLDTSPAWTTSSSLRHTRAPQDANDTVLQPSHFHPSESDYEIDSDWHYTDNEDTDSAASPFVFESEGEEVYLMPPSQRGPHDSIISYRLDIISEEHPRTQEI